MAMSSDPALDGLLHAAYADLKRSIGLGEVPMPNYNQVEAAVRDALINEELMARGRELKRIRQDGRYANSPDTMQQADIADQHAQNIPVLLMMRQNGAESYSWRDLPFWWPAILSPINASTSVFSASN
jgi:hypothetical protein